MTKRSQSKGLDQASEQPSRDDLDFNITDHPVTNEALMQVRRGNGHHASNRTVQLQKIGTLDKTVSGKSDYGIVAPGQFFESIGLCVTNNAGFVMKFTLQSMSSGATSQESAKFPAGKTVCIKNPF